MVSKIEHDKAEQKWLRRLKRIDVKLRKSDNLALSILINREAIYKATMEKIKSVEDLVCSSEEDTRAIYSNYHKLMAECETVLFKILPMFGMTPKHRGALQAQILTVEGMRKAVLVQEQKKEEKKKAEAEPAEAVKDFMEHFNRVAQP